MFKKAKAVWPAGREKELNLSVAFEAKAVSLIDSELYLSAAMFYRLYVNGQFVAFGPARTAKGYARVDVLPLGKFHNAQGNTIRIEVLGYNCRSLSTCEQSSFVCAELHCADQVIAYTGRDFIAFEMKQKVQKVQRYSVQRHFGEVWDMTQNELSLGAPVEVDNVPVFLPRVAPYPQYHDIGLDKNACRGVFEFDESAEFFKQRFSWKVVPEIWGRFEEDEIIHRPFAWIQRQRQIKTEENGALPIELTEGEYALFDFKRVECGFLQFSVSVQNEADVVIGFSEYCENNVFSFTNMNCQNVLEYILPEGQASPVCFEPYTARFAIVMVKKGKLTLNAFGIKTFQCRMTGARKVVLENPLHQKIYDAALRTFAHNAVDIYTDCPSRERAGWLCDSYFTAQTEAYFMGQVPVEDAFLENYRLCKEQLSTKGMLPMCYPSDTSITDNGEQRFIPQWCMWYVLEVEEYLRKRNTAIDAELFRESVMNIVTAFAEFENEDGLLENLPSWNFVEWSKANDWTQNVNYPTNFLYSAILDATYRLYGDETLKQKAELIRKRTVELSFDGKLFTDNAVRDEDGTLQNTGNTSEACQYYALLFGGIDWNECKYADLKQYVHGNFKNAADDGREFVPVNAFIGLYLRLMALLKLGQYDLILADVVDFFGDMADKTGTLWENRGFKGSFDHGFASYAAYAMCVALENKK